MTKPIRSVEITSYAADSPNGHIVMSIQRGTFREDNSTVIASSYRLRPGRRIERAVWLMLRHQQRTIERAVTA